MGISDLIKSTVRKYREKKEQRLSGLLESCRVVSLACREATMEHIAVMQKSIYYNYQLQESWKGKYKDIYDKTKKVKRYTRLNLPDDLIGSIKEFRDCYAGIENRCRQYNTEYIKREKESFRELFDNVEGRSLDDQQRECIVKDEINNLVVAGAGSGKTTTIVGKVKYLLKKYSYDPQDILVLSFTNASASEMSDRIKSETRENIKAMTFHKLGLEIISEVEGIKPSLTDIQLPEYVKEEFNSLSKLPSYSHMLNMYFISYLRQYKSSFDFDSEGEYFEYLRDTNIRTLKNEIVKSYEEMEIANFFITNRINYAYEKKYEVKTGSKEYRQYSPDFYLPDYGIYIEHFGIDRNGNVPGYFTGKDGMSAKETYNNSILWKRQIHENNGTTLIETFSFEKMEGVLIENLRRKLQTFGVKFDPMPSSEVWKLIEGDKNNEVGGFVTLIGTFITMLKSNNYSIEKINEINDKRGSRVDKSRNKAFISLVTPIYESYQKQLENSGDIDFNDMINKAANYVLQGRYIKKIGYIIIDEYQDISLTRYLLIKALKDKNNSMIFAVGDDWQSIYRFAGSQVSLFTEFPKYYGYTEISYIETTYRFNKSLIDLSSRFILKNKSQLKKELKAYNTSNETAYKLLYGWSAKELCSALREALSTLPNGSTVALLGRYKTDLEPYLGHELSAKYDHHTNKLKIKYNNRDLTIEFLSVHKSKGLQADYVFLLNNTNKKYGFPSQIEDDPVLGLFNADEEESFPYAEERRLFYVAITRAKKCLYLLIEETYKSPFVRELEENLGIKRCTPGGDLNKCPKCKKGDLVMKKGPYNSFFGCSNYPLCKYTKKIVE